MTNPFEVLEIICLLMNIASLVVLGVGWLTCADYYYACLKIMDGFLVFIHSVMSLSFSIASIIIGVAFDGFGKPPYANLVYFSILLFLVATAFTFGKLMDIRKYFASKRGRNV